MFSYTYSCCSWSCTSLIVPGSTCSADEFPVRSCYLSRILNVKQGQNLVFLGKKNCLLGGLRPRERLMVADPSCWAEKCVLVTSLSSHRTPSISFNGDAIPREDGPLQVQCRGDLFSTIQRPKRSIREGNGSCSEMADFIDAATPWGLSSLSHSRRGILGLSYIFVGFVMSLFSYDNFAEASVSRRVKLKDVDNQKLQDALRAAVAGDLVSAENMFTDIINEDPKSASGWSNRGSVRVSLGKYELAAQDFTKAIELAPEAPVPFLNRAISYEALGRYEEAIADCRTAIVNDPEEFAAWYNLGNVEVRVKDYDSALKAYERASALAPGIAGYRLRQALVLFQVDRLSEAKKLIQGLVRKYPNYSEARAALAAVLWSDGERSSAEEQFSQATQQEPLYSNLRWLTAEFQWPPRALQAMSNFLSIKY